MSRWATSFEEHNVHKTIVKIAEMLDVKPDQPDPAEAIERIRLIKIIGLFKSLLVSVDPELVPNSLLDELDGELSSASVLGAFEVYIEGAGADNFASVNDYIDEHVLSDLNQLAALATDHQLVDLGKETRDVFETFSEQSVEILDKLTAKVEDLAGKVDSNKQLSEEIQNSMSELKGVHSTQIEAWKAEFNSAQSARNNEFQEASVKQAATHAAATSNNETEFSEWFENTKKTTAEKFDTYFNDFQSKLRERSVSAQEKHESILALHDLVAGDSVAVGYLNDGKKEKEAADFWRVVSVVFIIATVGWLGFSFFLSIKSEGSDQNDWVSLARTASLTGVLLFGAAYTSRQSKSHRDQERRARWFGLEMKALDPYISSLPKEKQEEMKEKLADRIFGRETESRAEAEAFIDNTMLKTILSAISKSPK